MKKSIGNFLFILICCGLLLNAKVKVSKIDYVPGDDFVRLFLQTHQIMPIPDVFYPEKGNLRQVGDANQGCRDQDRPQGADFSISGDQGTECQEWRRLCRCGDRTERGGQLPGFHQRGRLVHRISGDQGDFGPNGKTPSGESGDGFAGPGQDRFPAGRKHFAAAVPECEGRRKTGGSGSGGIAVLGKARIRRHSDQGVAGAAGHRLEEYPGEKTFPRHPSAQCEVGEGKLQFSVGFPCGF